jgi:plastocyanin
MVRRIGSLVALIIVATLVLAACGSQDDEAEPTVTRVAVEGAPAPRTPTVAEAGQAEEPTEAPAAQGDDGGGGEAAGPVTIDVEMFDVNFDKKEIRVPANTEVTINLVNTGVAVHNFNIDELGVASGDYQPGQTGTVTFNSGAPGQYEFYCSIPGHRDAGMWGTLIVEEAGAAQAAEPTQPPASQGEEPTQAPAAQGETGDQGAAAAPVTINVEMFDVQFDKKEIRVPANTEITINLVNTGVAVHNFNIDELQAVSGDYQPAQTGTLVFNSGAPGEYVFYCSVPGHRDAGMWGTLIVEEAGAAPDGGQGEGSPAAEPAASPDTAASPAASPASSAAEPPASGATTLSIELVDVDFEPTELRVPANSEITITATNVGVAVHTFTISDLGVDTGNVISGQTVTVTFNSGPPGSHRYICSVPGHEPAGMTGTLIVE